jgi:predicted O-linked N-acetylglucosamine transferase (SPINDLY family)
MDIALDSFPYSGTTTSCESLLMGVPIITLFDNVRHYHSQNVTTSLLKNSDLSEFVAYTEEEYIQKAVDYASDLKSLGNLKHTTRDKFLNGKVLDYKEFITNFETLLLDTYRATFLKVTSKPLKQLKTESSNYKNIKMV